MEACWGNGVGGRPVKGSHDIRSNDYLRRWPAPLLFAIEMKEGFPMISAATVGSHVNNFVTFWYFLVINFVSLQPLTGMEREQHKYLAYIRSVLSVPSGT